MRGSYRRKAVVLLGGCAVLCGLVGVAHPAVAESTSADRVLQTVDVQMSPDGSVRKIQDARVSRYVTLSSKDESQNSTEVRAEKVKQDIRNLEVDTYSSQLPVRVTTAYKAGDRVGSDLADLEGFTGRLALNVTVTHTDTRLEKIDVDISGASQQRTMLVGSPFTVGRWLKLSAARLGWKRRLRLRRPRMSWRSFEVNCRRSRRIFSKLVAEPDSVSCNGVGCVSLGRAPHTITG